MDKVRELPSLGKKQISPNQFVTLADLAEFKSDILLSIKHLLSECQPKGKRWLKSYEVRQMLGISGGTLQTLRSSGILPYSKIGGIIYYSQENIDKLLQDHQSPICYRLRTDKRA